MYITVATPTILERSTVGDDIRLLSHQFLPRQGLYLNLGAPSTCNGTVTCWNYCYGNSFCSNHSHYATFMVYRPREDNSNELQLVPESIKSVSVRCQNKNPIKCGKEVLPRSEWFAIRKNDIVSVCLSQQRPRFQLISRKYVRFDEQVTTEIFQHRSTNCGEQQLLIDRRNLVMRSFLQLHLSAELISTEDQDVFDQQNDQLYLKTIPASLLGSTIIIITVAVVGALATLAWKKRKHKLKSTRSPPDTNGQSGNRSVTDVYSVPMQTRTRMDNIYVVRNNVAYNVNGSPQTNHTSSQDA